MNVTVWPCMHIVQHCCVEDCTAHAMLEMTMRPASTRFMCSFGHYTNIGSVAHIHVHNITYMKVDRTHF